MIDKKIQVKATVSSNLVEHFDGISADETSEDSIEDETKIVSSETDETSTSGESTVDETNIVSFNNKSTETDETSTFETEADEIFNMLEQE